MADYKTGDILISTKGAGHAAMVYRGDGDGGIVFGGTQIIHAQSGTHFHISSYTSDWPKTWHFTPSTPLNDHQKSTLRKIADAIRQRAQYGVGRMLTRLPFTSDKWSQGAQDRLKKYGDRLDAYFMEDHLENSPTSFGQVAQQNKQDAKIVSKVTCAEAVILCYQLMVRDPVDPLFPKLNARGTMPGALATFLRFNGNWRIKHDPAKEG